MAIYGQSKIVWRTKLRYCIVSDGDCHKYLCPLEKREEAVKILEEIVNYWDNKNYDKRLPDKPNYLIELGNLYRLNFTNPVIV